MPEKYPPIRFKAEVKQTLQDRADQLSSERGGAEVSLPSYIMEASQFFEDNRPKPELADAEVL